MRKALFITLGILAVLLVAGYGAVSYVLYDELSNIEDGCWLRGYEENRPVSWNTPPADDEDPPGMRDKWPADFDFSPYFMPAYETVTFPSRDSEQEIDISGWYVPGEPGAPAVIWVHGLGSCKYSPAVLTPAGILNRAGYHVLVVDMRDTADSTCEDGRSSVGTEEYLDLLGAWDWLVAEKGFAPDQIGLGGNSMGAATTLIAFDQEPRVAAVFVDSPFADLPTAIREELQTNGYPTWMAWGGITVARLVSGDQIDAFDPRDAVRHAGDRPLFVAHSRADQRIDYHHAEILAEVAAESGTQLTTWIVDDAPHNRILGLHPQEYEEHLLAFFGDALGE